jgi:hypothetical protein
MIGTASVSVSSSKVVFTRLLFDISTSYDVSTQMMMVVLLELHCSCCKPSSIEARAMCRCTATLVQSEVYIRQDMAHNSKMFPVRV